MDKTIYYLGYYDTDANKSENRNYVLAASNKMTYIVSALERAGFCVELISASQTHNPQKYEAKTVPVGEKSRLHLFKTLPWGNKLRRICSTLYGAWQVFRYLRRHVGKDDTLVVYHSLAYARTVRWLKKRKGFRLVLEVEEIYADVSGREKERTLEYALFRCADAYIFPTELLNEKLNVQERPYAIVCGTYEVQSDRQCSFGDDHIHAVYAGTFDPRKGGAQTAVAAAAFLPEKYHMHIIGFGNRQDTQNLQNAVREAAERCAGLLTYDGCLSGEDYIRFLQSCQIGLSTQNADAQFNDTSFPSKVLSYLANGMRVVSVRIPVLERSEVGDLLYFYDENTPQAVAEAICRVDVTEPYDSRRRIAELDEAFVTALGAMLDARG